MGIDAAWTPTNPSGVALVTLGGSGWRLVSSHASYPDFLGGGASHAPDAQSLLAKAEQLTGKRVDIVAVDMPLALSPINGRRPSDNAVSAEYGARWCSTHSPSAVRPGPLSDVLTAEFDAAGYPLATAQPTGSALIEVYPHTALVELIGSAWRWEYKVSNAGKYWREEKPVARRRKLFTVWRHIIDHLDNEIAGTAASLILPDPDAPIKTLKAFEDRLDAVVCAWVGICVLEGKAKPLGDDDSAIWSPDPRLFSSHSERMSVE